MKNNLKYIVSFLLLIQLGCNGGIAPIPIEEETGFSGTITFWGEWPEGIKRTHLVAFKNEIQTLNDFLPPNLGFASDTISYGISFLEYNSNNNPLIEIKPGVYKYIVVAHSKTPTFSLNRVDWFVSGVYYFEGDTTKPGILDLTEGRIITGVNIVCDFNNPPPQPPGGN